MVTLSQVMLAPWLIPDATGPGAFRTAPRATLTASVVGQPIPSLFVTALACRGIAAFAADTRQGPCRCALSLRPSSDGANQM